MRKTTKIWLIIATSLVLVGCIIFGGVLCMLKWDFTKLSTVKYETNSYEINESYKNISVITDTTDIKLLPSGNGKCSVICYEQKNVKHLVEVKDDTLEIKVVDIRKWYEHIGIVFSSPKITVYLPNAQYDKLSIKENTGDVEIAKDFTFESINISTSTGSVKNYASAQKLIGIKTSTGNIKVKNISASALDLSVSTGNITAETIACDGDIKVHVSTGCTQISDAKCMTISSSGSTGDISLKNTIATEKLSIERSTGDVKLDGSDAAELFIKTDTGSVKGSLLSDKIFFVKSDTGSINVPKTGNGGKCDITTDTGDIKITIKTDTKLLGL